MRANANGHGNGRQPLFNRAPPPQLQIQIHHANLQRQSQSLESMGMISPTRSVTRAKSTSPRRSSRPASPSATSFGHRFRTESAPSSVASCSSAMQYHQAQRRETPRQHSSSGDMCSTPTSIHPSHVTTPPTAYYPPNQSHVPPPPSPYRPTTTQERHWVGNRALPEQLPMTREMAPRPPRHPSLFPSSSRSSRVGSRPTSGASLLEIAGVDVPMLNIIPATPQDPSDEFAKTAAGGPGRRRLPEELADPITIHRMTEISLAADDSEEISTQSLPKSDSTPAIQVELDFSPFSPTIELALDDFGSAGIASNQVEPEPAPMADAMVEQADAPGPSSPPFDSYPSLPSLSSQSSLQSDRSLKSSSSMTSVMSFPDVEEALGSMLGSLSDGNMATIEAEMGYAPLPVTDKDARQRAASAPPANPGLGLGLDLPEATSFVTAPLTVTSPLSPRKSKPGRIDTALAQTVLTHQSADGTPQTAPPVINHRVAFYGTARAHPNSPTSGVFTRSLDDIASHSHSDDGYRTPTMPPRLPSSSALSTTSRDSVSTISQGTIGCRDSISAHSESSDEDLHTASIINLTPVVGRSYAEVRGEEVMVDEVGLAL